MKDKKIADSFKKTEGSKNIPEKDRIPDDSLDKVTGGTDVVDIFQQVLANNQATDNSSDIKENLGSGYKVLRMRTPRQMK